MKERAMITVTFNQEDLNVLHTLLDVAVKASGLQGAKAALGIMAKLEAAVAEVNSQKEEGSD